MKALPKKCVLIFLLGNLQRFYSQRKRLLLKEGDDDTFTWTLEVPLQLAKDILSKNRHYDIFIRKF